MPPISLSDLQQTLDNLHIPAEFLKDEPLNDETTARLQQWKAVSVTNLSELKDLLGETKVADVDEAAATVFAVAPFDREGDWSNNESITTAQGAYNINLSTCMC